MDPPSRGAAGLEPVEAMNDADRRSSPDGRFTIETTAWEARMSHWIETPRLVDASGAVNVSRSMVETVTRLSSCALVTP